MVRALLIAGLLSRGCASLAQAAPRIVLANPFSSLVCSLDAALGAVVEMPLGAAPRSVAVDPEGTGWIADVALPRLHHVTEGVPDGLGADLPFVPTAVALLAGGGAAAVGGPVASPSGSFALVDPAGGVDVVAAVPPGPVLVVAPRGGGFVVAHKSLQSPVVLSSLDAAGALIGWLSGGSFPTDMALDEDGRILVTHVSDGRVRRFAADLSEIGEIVVPQGVHGVCPDGEGGFWLTYPAIDAIRHVHASGQILGDVEVRGAPQGIARTPSGNIVVSGPALGSLRLHTHDGYAIAEILLLPGLSGSGDPTGMDFAAGAGAGLDLDADGAANGEESSAATDPCDPVSVPLSVQVLGVPQPGATVPLRVLAPSCPIRAFLVGLSCGAAGPGSQGYPPLPLAPSPLLDACLHGTSSVLSPTVGILDATGAAYVLLAVPPMPELHGAVFHAATLLADPFDGWRIVRVSAPSRIQVP